MDIKGHALRITTVIIAQNEADRILSAIGSCRAFSDEILVIDGGSVDNTVEICRGARCRVIENKWPGYAQQRNFGANLAEHDWIFVIDADEVADPSIDAEINRIKNTDVSDDQTFAVWRKSIFWGKAVASERRPLRRLYNRKVNSFVQTDVHEDISDISQKTSTLNGFLAHDGSRDLFHHIEKLNRYTSLDATDRIRAGARFSVVRMLFKPILIFFYYYIAKKNVMLGMTGFVVSYHNSWYALICELKIYEQLRAKNFAADPAA